MWDLVAVHGHRWRFLASLDELRPRTASSIKLRYKLLLKNKTLKDQAVQKGTPEAAHAAQQTSAAEDPSQKKTAEALMHMRQLTGRNDSEATRRASPRLVLKEPHSCYAARQGQVEICARLSALRAAKQEPTQTEPEQQQTIVLEARCVDASTGLPEVREKGGWQGGLLEKFISTERGRRRACGGSSEARGSWTRAIMWHLRSVDKPTWRVRQFIRLWSLGTAAKKYRGLAVMAVNVRRAVGIVKRRLRKAGKDPMTVYCKKVPPATRDAWGLTYGPRDKLGTLLTTHDNRLWLCGPAMEATGGGRWMTGEEYLNLMGLDRRQPCVLKGIQILSEEELRAAGADSIYSRFADLMVAQGLSLSHLDKKQEPLRYGGLCMGAFDALLLALRRKHPKGARCVLAAEKDQDRMTCLRAGFQPEHEYSSMEDAAEHFTGRLDILTVTHPCKVTSTAPNTAKENWAARRRTAEQYVAHVSKVVEAKVQHTRPQLILIEQPVTQRTHFKTAYNMFNENLQRLPYKWWHGERDATQLGAEHARPRMAWIGISQGS